MFDTSASQTAREMIHAALERRASDYKTLYESVSPPLEGLMKISRAHKRLARRVRKTFA